jgi:TetR/AcrR family transcriptional regulator, tetracycline repressor protein
VGWQAVPVSRRDEVLEAALDLLDDVGLAALTTRRLAERLGVRPGALYRHFDSKQALLVAMVDRTLADAPPVPVDRPWPDQVRAIATAARAAMLSRRDGALLVIGNVVRSTRGQASWTAFLDALRSAGFPDDAAQLAADTVLGYVGGFTMEEQARDPFPPDPARRTWRERNFQAGLELIISGISVTLRPGSGGAGVDRPHAPGAGSVTEG